MVTYMIRSDSSHAVPIRAVVAARYRLDSDALSALFQSQSDIRVLSTANSIQAASSAGRLRRPDVLLLDGEFVVGHDEPGIAALAEQLRPTPILLLDREVNHGRLAAVLETRGVSYFTRGVPFAELAAAIRRLVQGDRVFDPAVSHRVHQTPHGWRLRKDANGSPLSLLTPREIEVLKLIAAGHSVKHWRNCSTWHPAPSTTTNPG